MKTPLVVLALAIILCHTAYSQSGQPVDSRKIIEKGIRFHSEKKYKDAIKEYRQVPRNDTNYAWSLYELAYSASLDSNFTESLRAIEEALELDDDSQDLNLLSLRASVADDMGDTEKSIRLYDSALVKFPNAEILMLNKGISLIRLKNYDEAEKVFKDLLLRNPYYASAHFRLGFCALQKGQIAKSMMSFFTYLVNSPTGQFQSNCINILSEISKNTTGVMDLVEKRKEDAGSGFSMLEQILFSKIALDKNYKISTDVDDPIIRQLQVMMEKLEYDPSNNDFWMQFYVPYLKSIFDSKQFEPAVNYAFSNVNLDQIKRYLKKNTKELSAFVTATQLNFEKIRSTRELDFQKRQAMPPMFHYSNGILIGKGEVVDDNTVGKWEFYHENGNLKAIGSYNNKGEKTGKWMYYFDNGKLTGFDNWKDGAQHGEDILYNRYGILIEQSAYVNGKMHGEVKVYYYNGKLKAITPYNNGVEEGKYLEYYISGRKKIEAMTANDKFHGNYLSFYENGLPEYDVVYTDGKLNGSYKYYYSNGNKKIICQYKNGEIDGEVLSYHTNGKISKRSTYTNGLVDGEEKEYNEEGIVITKSLYKNGKSFGLSEYFDDDGILFSTFNFENDILKEARYFDKKGKLISTSVRKNKVLDLTVYAPGGYKISNTQYNDKSEVLGRQTYFYPSGKIKETNNYVDGMLEGTSTGYYPNGTKQFEIQYTKDEKNGFSRYFFFNGKPSSEAWYVNGELNGDYTEFNAKGIVTSFSTYLDGDIFGVRTWNRSNGKTYEKEVFENGMVKHTIQYDSLGKKINTSTFENGAGKYNGIHFNGKKSYTGAKVNGLPHGKYFNYYFDETVFVEKNYENGNLHGEYSEYHYGGKPSVKGQYSHGDMTGNWKYISTTGKVWKDATYVHGELQGKVSFFNASGGLEKEVEYRDDNRNGITTRYYDDGQLTFQLLFKDNKLKAYTYPDNTGKLLPMIPVIGGNARIVTYFKNGTKSAEMEYADGELTGTYSLYHPDGKLFYQSNEVFGNTEGKTTEFYPDGKLYAEFNFVAGENDGPYKKYHPNGKLSEEGNYFMGDLNGTRKFYDINGKLTETQQYYYGTLLNSIK